MTQRRVARASAEVACARHGCLTSCSRFWSIIWGSAWTVPYLNTVSIPISVPLLHNAIERVPPVTAAVTPYPAVFNFNWLASAGTATFIAAVLSALFHGYLARRVSRSSWPPPSSG